MHYMDYFNKQIECIFRGMKFLEGYKEHWFTLVDIDLLATFNVGSSVLDQLSKFINFPHISYEQKLDLGFAPLNVTLTLDMLETIWASYIYIQQKGFYLLEETVEMRVVKPIN